MNHPTISDCDDSQCVVAPFWLRDAVSVHQCPLCHFNVYNCSAAPGYPKWHRITPASGQCITPKISVGDWVHIVEGPYEGFDATIDEINPSDQVVRVWLHLMGRKVPFWIALRSVRLLESKQ